MIKNIGNVQSALMILVIMIIRFVKSVKVFLQKIRLTSSPVTSDTSVIKGNPSIIRWGLNISIKL